MRKFLSVFMVLVMLFTTFATTSVVSFAGGTEVDVVSETEEMGFFQQVGKFFDDVGKAIKIFFEDIGKAVSDFFNSIFGTGSSIDKPNKPVENWTTEEILRYYQDATAKVVAERPGYRKSRQTVLINYDAGLVIEQFKSVFYSFLGIGAENACFDIITKGTNTNDDKCGEFLNESTLTTDDITSVEIINNGSCYVITIGIKEGLSKIEGGINYSNESPIEKTGICIGTTDRQGFDHKNAMIIYDAIDDVVPEVKVGEINDNGKVVATIDAKTGEIQELVISWDENTGILGFYGSSGVFLTTTTVTYTDFGWNK